jgi:serine phosphatase RsbU (regulator of sigma subunit)
MARIADSFRQYCAYSPELVVGALVDSMPYPLIVRDLDHRVILVNRAARDFYPHDVLGRSCRETSPLERVLCADCPAEKALAEGRPDEREVQHPTTARRYLVGFYPLHDPDGRPCGVIETVRDVTDDRRREQRIASLLAEATARNQELAGWRRRLQLELRVAREIQMRLVPQGPLCLAGVCFDFFYRPSGEVGGDVFDVLPIDDTRVGMVIADASGHGVAAGLVAVMVRMVCQAYGLDASDPALVLRALNEELYSVVPPGQFATAFYAVADSGRNVLRYAAAGHPPPLLLRPHPRADQWLREAGLPLGTVPDADFKEAAAEFPPGDRLLLFTDGVLDAVSDAGERMGVDRLADLAGAHREQTGPDFLHAMVEDVEQFLGAADASDDITIALVEHLARRPGGRRPVR